METKVRKKAASPKSGSARTGRGPGAADKPRRTKTGGKGGTGRTRNAAAKPVRRQRTTAKQPVSDVVYTQPGPFNRNRMLLHLGTVAAVVLALIFGISIFFKVADVTVAGNNRYTPAQVLDASGIKTGDNLIGINRAKITSSILKELPYITRVRVGIKLPDTVKIEVVELEVVYSVQADDGSWWLMRADGNIVEKTSEAEAELHTKVLGVQITAPAAGQKATAAQPVSQETAPDGATLPVAVSAAQQLETAISVLQVTEENSILGELASVDVSDLADVTLWYGKQYQVVLGDSTQLVYKIKSMKSAINEMGDYQSGILDVSFTIKEDSVVYTPFE